MMATFPEPMPSESQQMHVEANLGEDAGVPSPKASPKELVKPKDHSSELDEEGENTMNECTVLSESDNSQNRIGKPDTVDSVEDRSKSPIENDKPDSPALITTPLQVDLAGESEEGETPKSPLKRHWEHWAYEETLAVVCKQKVGILHKSKFGSGGRGSCIAMNNCWFTPSQFELKCGRGYSKDWKRSIKFGGRPLSALIEDGILTPHSTACTCGVCCDDLAMKSPVTYYVPTKRRRKVQEGPSTVERFLQYVNSMTTSRTGSSPVTSVSTAPPPATPRRVSRPALPLSALLPSLHRLPATCVASVPSMVSVTTTACPIETSVTTLAEGSNLLNPGVMIPPENTCHTFRGSNMPSVSPTCTSSSVSALSPTYSPYSSGICFSASELNMFSQLDSMAENLQQQVGQLKLQIEQAKVACLQAKVDMANEIEARHQKEKEEVLQAILGDVDMKQYFKDEQEKEQEEEEEEEEQSVDKVPYSSAAAVAPILTCVNGQLFLMQGNLNSAPM